MSLATYADKFSQLNVGRIAGHERPHKPVMLLALLDLFEQRVIKENKITYSPELLELFGEYYDDPRNGIALCKTAKNAFTRAHKEE